MTTTPATSAAASFDSTAGWHRNGPTSDIYTRNPVPRLDAGHYQLRDLLTLTEEQSLRDTAFHEAAHAVVYLHFGATVEGIYVRTASEIEDGQLGGEVFAGGNLSLEGALVALAAGERAEDRWLHENGLWTPTRAWAVERLAAPGDRAQSAALHLAHAGSVMTYGTAGAGEFDYRSVHQAADDVLARAGVWDEVTALADALVARRRLAGHEVSAVLSAAGTTI